MELNRAIPENSPTKFFVIRGKICFHVGFFVIRGKICFHVGFFFMWGSLYAMSTMNDKSKS